MAIGHLSVKVGKVGKAVPHAAYIARVGEYVNRLNRGELLEATGYGNMPAWAAHNPAHFWEAADQNERSNGSTYREHEIALPRELSPDQRRELVEDWIQKEIGIHYVYQYAIHTPKAADGAEQPHAHLMFSERRLDGIERDPEQFFKRYNNKNPERGGAKKGFGDHAGQKLTRAERKEDLKVLRDRWEKLANAHLEKSGSPARIDMRSYQDQELDIQPERKMHPSEWRTPEKRAGVLAYRESKAELLKARQVLHRMVPDMKAALKAADEKANAWATPEKIKREWEKYLEQAGKDLDAERQRRRDAAAVARKEWLELKEPEPPQGIFASITGQRRQYQKDHAAWQQEEKRLRFAKNDADRLQEQPLPSRVLVAEQRLEQQAPEIFKEWQRLKALAEQQEKAERDRLRKERQEQRRNRGKGFER